MQQTGKTKQSKGAIMITWLLFVVIGIIIGAVHAKKAKEGFGGYFKKIAFGIFLGCVVGIFVMLFLGPLGFETQWVEKDTVAIYSFSQCPNIYLYKEAGYLYVNTSAEVGSFSPFQVRVLDAEFPFDAKDNLEFGPTNSVRTYVRSFVEDWPGWFLSCYEERCLINLQPDQILAVRFGS